MAGKKLTRREVKRRLRVGRLTRHVNSIIGAKVLAAGGKPGDVPTYAPGWTENGQQKLDAGLLPHEVEKLTQIGGAISKATTSNPKDLFGAVKVSFTKVSAIALAHCAHAMMDGARKYGPYNWRAKPVIVSIYIDAAMRHALAYFEGERCAADSKAHHLGHAMACCAILLDAEAHGCLIDDRPNGKGVFSRVLEEISALIKLSQAEHQAKQEAEARKVPINLCSYPMQATVRRLKRKKRRKAKKGVW